VKSRQPLDLPKKQGGYGRVRSSSSRSRESLGSLVSYPSAVGSDRSCTRVTIGIRRIGSPVVECFSTFETPKSREDLDRPSVGHVVEIEASGVGKSEVPWIGDRGSP
jgi:hypothetical protein